MPAACSESVCRLTVAIPRGPAIRVLLATSGWPSGILEVGSWATRLERVEVAICQIDNAEEEAGSQGALTALARALEKHRPHVVGFRVEGEPFEPIRDWIRCVRERCDAEVVLGGPTATSHPRELLDWSGADYVFAGEAEETFARFLELARRPHSRDLLPEIPGITYRYGDYTFHNTLPADGYGRSVLEVHSPGGASITCLRSAVRPIVSPEVLAANRLNWSLLDGFERPFDSLYFTGGRGCPGSCTFCAQLHGPQVRIKSASQLLEEIECADACVAEGRLALTRWPLFAHVEDETLQTLEVSWAAIYDEDFFLDASRAIEFFERWSRSPLRGRYRLSLQTNPCSLLSRKSGSSSFSVRTELLGWIDRVKPMVQLGAESFHPELLARWHKRHNLDQLEQVLEALDATRQDYTVFQLLTDFDSTAEELIEALRRLVLAAFAHRRMRIASSPYTIPLYESDTRRSLEFAGRLAASWICDFRDYERPHREWMDRVVADLADLADERLHWALRPETREGALLETMPAIIEYLERLSAAPAALKQARAAADEIADARFRFSGPVSGR